MVKGEKKVGQLNGGNPKGGGLGYWGEKWGKRWSPNGKKPPRGLERTKAGNGKNRGNSGSGL